MYLLCVPELIRLHATMWYLEFREQLDGIGSGLLPYWIQDQTQVARLKSKHFYLLTYLVGWVRGTLIKENIYLGLSYSLAV